MADAPDNASYVLMTGLSALPNNRQLSSTAGIVIGDTGPGGFVVISPDDFLLSLQDISDTGIICRTTTNTAASRELATDGTIAITNPRGIAGNPTFGVVPSSSVQNIQIQQGGVLQSTQSTINIVGTNGIGVVVSNDGGADRANITISGGGAPSDATFIIQTPNDGLSHEQALSLLATGIMKNTTNTGVITIAQAGTDYQAPSALLTSIAALTPAQGGLMVGTGGGSFAMRTIGANGTVPVSNGTDWAWGAQTGAPANATYVTTSENGGLSADFSLGSLTTGLLKVNVTGGVGTPAVAGLGIDYYAPGNPTTITDNVTDNILYVGNTAGGGSAGSAIAFGHGTLNDSTSEGVVAIGTNACKELSGNQVVAVGQLVLQMASGFSGLTAVVGDHALSNATDAPQCTVIGALAGSTQAVYSSATLVGYLADATVSGLANVTSIGQNSQVSASHMMNLGGNDGTNAQRVCIGMANPNSGIVRTSCLILGSDNTTHPHIYFSSSTSPSMGVVAANDVVLSANGGTMYMTTASNQFPIMPDVFTAQGDLLVATGSPSFAPGRLAIGANGTFLSSNGTTAIWQATATIAQGGTGQTTASAAFNALSPITTAGDIILGNGANSATRLGIGANDTVLTSNGTTANWQPVAASINTPIIYQATGGFLSSNTTASPSITYTPDAALLSLISNSASTGVLYANVPLQGTSVITDYFYFIMGTNVGNSPTNLVRYNGTNVPICGYSGIIDLSSEAGPGVNQLILLLLTSDLTGTLTISSFPVNIYFTYFPAGLQ